MGFERRKCKICKKKLVGRSDKLFCSVICKNYYHTSLRKVTNVEALEIDAILHRNRSILLEIMGKNCREKKISRIILENKKFSFKYITHYYINSKGKTFHWVYDFAWMSFSDDEVFIIRKKKIP